jgi:hypothetical protein
MLAVGSSQASDRAVNTPHDSLARNRPAAPAGADTDYAAIHATISATERGRWFLDEHARRSRSADAGQVLTAVEPVEAPVGGDTATEPPHGLPSSDASPRC